MMSNVACTPYAGAANDVCHMCGLGLCYKCSRIVGTSRIAVPVCLSHLSYTAPPINRARVLAALMWREVIGLVSEAERTLGPWCLCRVHGGDL